VEAFEDVRVMPAVLKAFRIQFTITNERGKGASLTAWYAPEARQFVKVTSHEMHMADFEVVAFDRPPVRPLEIIVQQPRDETRVDSEALTVIAGARSDAGVARVTVSLNGVDVGARDESGKPQREVRLSQPLKLREGRNVVLVTAAEASGQTRQESRVVHYEPARATPPAAAPAIAPLQITLTSPADKARVEQDGIALAGVVAGGKGVSQVVVTLNGVEAGRRDDKSAPRALPLNQPLTLREGQNTIVVTAMGPDGGLHQEVRSVEYVRRVPLTVTVRYPEDKVRVTDEASVVAALVTSSKGVAKVTVALNGAEISQQTERTPPSTMAVTVPVTLRAGANAVAITATEADGTTRQEIRTVFYDVARAPSAKATAPPPVAPPAPARNQWAVVIGVGAYDSPAIPRLRYTVSDAEAIYQTLVGAAGFKKDNVLLLTDRTERKPTLRNIKWALGTFLGRSAARDDTVLIFFAGHGAPEVDTRGLERDGLAKYLIPSDADPDDLYSTALPMDELQTIFGRIEAERVVAFLDACYSGAAGGRTFTSKKTRAGSVDDLFLERLTRSKGRAIITASRTTEVSIELPELGHGIFSYYLVEGLKGAADLNRDGIVSLQELYEYVEQQVTAKSRSVGGNQHPVMKGELEGVLPLAKVRNR